MNQNAMFVFILFLDARGDNDQQIDIVEFLMNTVPHKLNLVHKKLENVFSFKLLFWSWSTKIYQYKTYGEIIKMIP